MTHDDRRVTAEMWRASVSLSPWHDRTQVMIIYGRKIDGKRVTVLEFSNLEVKANT